MTPNANNRRRRLTVLASASLVILAGCGAAGTLYNQAQSTSMRVAAADSISVSGNFFDRQRKEYVSKSVTFTTKDEIQRVKDALFGEITPKNVHKFKSGDLFSTKISVSITGYSNSTQIAHVKVMGSSFLILDGEISCEVEQNVSDALYKLVASRSK